MEDREKEVESSAKPAAAEGDKEDQKQKYRQLGDRMKKYESAKEAQLDPTQPYIIRLDGHLFSAFTKQFKKPYDVRIFEAMLKTTADLLKKFKAVTAYTQSDEITLVFPAVRPKPEQTEKKLIYDGRINKLATLAAGYCSVRFVYHMLQTKFEEGEDAEQFRRKIFQTYFDARAFSLPSTLEVLENVVWRISDVKRNSKNNLGCQYYTPKELFKLSPSAVVQKLKDEKGVHWEEMPAPYKYGCFVKREQYKADFLDKKTGEVKGSTTRVRLASGCLDFHGMCLKEAGEESSLSALENTKEHKKKINFLMEKFMDSSLEWYRFFQPFELDKEEEERWRARKKEQGQQEEEGNKKKKKKKGKKE